MFRAVTKILNFQKFGKTKKQRKMRRFFILTVNYRGKKCESKLRILMYLINFLLFVSEIHIQIITPILK